jgi:hypothetical protein
MLSTLADSLGWSICPTDIFRNNTCATDKSWTTFQPDQQTLLSVFRQYATTAYHRQNFSIINVDTVSPPQQVVIDPGDFRAIWEKLFDPGSNATSDDAVMVNSFMFGLGWYLRLYKDQFKDDGQSPLNLLRNFLTIPIQFSTTALQFSNATLPGTGLFQMPSYLETTASAAKVTPRFIGQLWTVCTFIATCSVLVLWAGCILGWILFQKPLLTDPSAFPEFDIVAKSGRSTQQGLTLSDVAQSEELTDAGSWTITRAIRKKIGRMIRVRFPGEKAYHPVFVVLEDKAFEQGIELESLGLEMENAAAPNLARLPRKRLWGKRWLK